MVGGAAGFDLLVVFSRVMSWTWCSQFSIAQRPRSQPATCPATS